MNTILWITTIVLLINAAQSYILLTANLDDVQSIVKQMADSPVADQLKRIWHRASSQFRQQMGRSRMHQRAADEKVDGSKGIQWGNVIEDLSNIFIGTEENPSRNEDESRDRESRESDAHEDLNVKRRHGDDVAALGKNASYYLSSIKDVMKTIVGQ